MTVFELAGQLSFELLTPKADVNREIHGCYVGDLLSWVMGRAKQDDVWVTVMSNVNIVAVATLSDVACIVLAEDVMPDAAALEKAEAQQVVLLRSPLPAFETAIKIADVLGLC